ncbi:Glu-tRNA(Gln) amidotransferase subunit GatD [Acidianus brierleyi]|uniref:Glutamyl-tRNA(Gln) amidotransferase subunit D n=1 Tax=Acidianus brierleyi TaxID=41673 RepID=A0A2U9IG35_9CREN|nr:Glu-tRNA(Gln) amidotransferase subunit GatD [Acidianus brierleyi]AWR95001.1 Glu-tRNA(Gln) amidotransferase subunit GatD [Acidianus brierleyi]
MSLEGYRGKALDILSKLNVNIGDIIEISRDSFKIKGILMPSYSRDDSIIVIKMENGYNVGISVDNSKISVLEKRIQKPLNVMPEKEEKSEVKIISTGGTIASKIEYETGAVRPALSTEEIIQFMPEINEIAKISAEILFSILSENMSPDKWIKIAEAIKSAFDKGNLGVVIAHGTDTLAYTAAALSFSLKKLQGPVVLVGSQRSSDRPSSDSPINLYSSVLLAKKAPFGEVVINMHGESSDLYTLAHRGVKVRKMHTSRRDAFQSINDKPLAKVLWLEKEIKILRPDYHTKDEETTVDSKFDNRVFLLKYYPGFDPSFIDYLVDTKKIRGIIIEGTGLGHTSTELLDSFKKAAKDGIFLGMTSQCIFGRVNMNVYTTGRLLQQVGVVPLEDMLPEVALVKLMWVLAHENDIEKIKNLMLTNLVGEINSRHSLDFFPRWYHE